MRLFLVLFLFLVFNCNILSFYTYYKMSNSRIEKKLYKKIRENDKDAFMKAYDLYVDEIYRFIFFKVKSKEEAEDISSSVFLKAWNYINDSKVLEEKTLRALFYKIARTTIIDHYRKSSSQTGDVSIDSTDSVFDIKDQNQNIHKSLELRNDTEKVMLKLDLLKDEYREVVLMRYINEMTIDEIARITQKSKGNVRVLTHRALKALEELINDDER